MKKIYNLQVNTSDMEAGITTRSFTVSGDKGAGFILYVIQEGTIKYYDFADKSFELGHNNIDNNLKIELKSKVYNGQITFPSGAATYIIKLMATQGTEIQGSNKYIISKSITKLASDATVTFQAATANTSNYATFPTTTSSGSPTEAASFSFNWDITNASTDSHGFGLIPQDVIYRIESNAWYFTTTDTVDGAITSATEVVVDDVTDIVVGMIITGVSSGSLSGTPYILAIDTDTKTLSLNTSQTFSDGKTLTFKAVGPAAIKNAIGLEVEFVEFPEIDPTALTKTIRAGSSGTTLNLNGTYGISGGVNIPVSGLGIDNSSGQTTVTSVSASSSAGSIVVNNSQSDIAAVGTVLTFSDVHQVINIRGTIKILQYPTANRTINLDLDNLISVGTAG